MTLRLTDLNSVRLHEDADDAPDLEALCAAREELPALLQAVMEDQTHAASQELLTVLGVVASSLNTLRILHPDCMEGVMEAVAGEVAQIHSALTAMHLTGRMTDAQRRNLCSGVKKILEQVQQPETVQDCRLL